MTASQSASVSCCMGPTESMPALFTRMSNRSELGLDFRRQTLDVREPGHIGRKAARPSPGRSGDSFADSLQASTIGPTAQCLRPPPRAPSPSSVRARARRRYKLRSSVEPETFQNVLVGHGF